MIIGRKLVPFEEVPDSAELLLVVLVALLEVELVVVLVVVFVVLFVVVLMYFAIWKKEK